MLGRLTTWQVIVSAKASSSRGSRFCSARAPHALKYTLDIFHDSMTFQNSVDIKELCDHHIFQNLTLTSLNNHKKIVKCKFLSVK